MFLHLTKLQDKSRERIELEVNYLMYMFQITNIITLKFNKV